MHELRSVNAEVRMVEGADGKRVLRGYGLVYNSPSVVMTDESGRKFREIVRPESVARVLADPGVDLTVDMHHNPEKVLGRRGAGTARFGSDERGLWYEVPDLPDVSYARDLAVSVGRRDIPGSSFVFSTIEDDWSDPDERGIYTRELRSIHVFNMGPVTNPAYRTTTATVRSLDAWREARSAAAAATAAATAHPDLGALSRLLNEFRLAELG